MRINCVGSSANLLFLISIIATGIAGDILGVWLMSLLAGMQNEV